MSDFYLCDVCSQMTDDHLTTCACVPLPDEHQKVAMHDHHGVGGVRYLDPMMVCAEYERREVDE